MSFEERIIEFCEKINEIKDQILTEEATKMSLVLPLFQILGYNVFDPCEFLPEYTADVGVKKKEKVDFAIMQGGSPRILIEAKCCSENIDKHSSQLFRYYGTTDAKFAILTNGIRYNFYTDLDELNKMDLTPFLEIDLLNLRPGQISHLEKFCKDQFDADAVFDIASKLNYYKTIRKTIEKEIQNPSDDFVKFMISGFYSRRNTQNVIDSFKPIIKKSISDYINDLVAERLAEAQPLKSEKQSADTGGATPEEIECFYIIRSIVSEILSRDLITYKHTDSYFSVLYNNNSRKWICRIILSPEKKQILFPDGNKGFDRYYLDHVNDIYQYKNQLYESVNRVRSGKATKKDAAAQQTITQTRLSENPDHGSLKKNDSNCIPLSKGQRIKASEVGIGDHLDVVINLDSNQRSILDIACFGVNKDNKIENDDYFIFYNQTESPDGAIKMRLGEHSASNSISIQFPKLPNSICKMIFTLSIDGEIDMSRLLPAAIEFCSGTEVLCNYEFDGSGFQQEKAIILCEIYLKNSEWSINIVGQGFNGGLDSLLSHFGGQCV